MGLTEYNNVDYKNVHGDDGVHGNLTRLFSMVHFKTRIL